MQRAKMQKADGIQPQAWNEVVASLPGAHVLQTWEWAQVKSHFGWQPDPRLWLDSSGKVVAAAMLLHRAIPIGGFSARLRVIYAPKGPLLDWNEPLLRRCVLDDLAKMAYKQGGIFIKIDPSPVMLITVFSGTATFAPIAAGKPNPIVPSRPNAIASDIGNP